MFDNTSLNVTKAYREGQILEVAYTRGKEAQMLERKVIEGVLWVAKRKCWRAKICLNGKYTINLGEYQTLLDAVAARKSYENKHRAR
jgi:hypothetical protein